MPIELPRPGEELIARRAKELAELARFDPEHLGETTSEDEKASLIPLHEEIIRYHARYRPSRRPVINFLSREDA